MTGTLYIVATPIGNLEDVTLRALRTLKEVDEILCEDTRHTKRLLDRYEITTPVRSYHEHSSSEKESKLLERLLAGESFALVSDAGTPGISDPGASLVRLARERDVRVEPIPGPAALTAMLSVAGLDEGDFYFIGFLPHKKGRETALKSAAVMNTTIVLYEAPTRLQRLLAQIEAIMPSRTIQVGRELTKIHEELKRGLSTEIMQYYKDHPPKGEVVVIIEKAVFLGLDPRTDT